MEKEAVANKVIRTRIIPFLRKHITDDDFHGKPYLFPIDKASGLIIGGREPSWNRYTVGMKYADLNSPIHKRYGFDSKEDLLDAYRKHKQQDRRGREFAGNHRKGSITNRYPAAEFMSYLEPYAKATLHRKPGLSRYNSLLARKSVLNRGIFGNPETAPVYPLDLGDTSPYDYSNGLDDFSDVISSLSGYSVVDDKTRLPLLHTFTARRPFMRTPHLADAPSSRELNDYGRRTNSGVSRVADVADPRRIRHKPENAEKPAEWATGRQLSEDELNALFDTDQHHTPWYEMVEDVGPYLPMYTGSYTPITEDNIKLFKDYGIDLLSRKQLPLKDIQGRSDFNLYKGTPVDTFTPVKYELSGGAKLRDAIKRRLDSYNAASPEPEPQNGLLSRMFRPFRSLWNNLTRKSPGHSRPHTGEKNYDSEFMKQLMDPKRPLVTRPNTERIRPENNVIANALPEENLDVVNAWPEGDPLWFTNSIGVGATHINGTGVAGWKEPWVDKDFMYAALDPEDIVKMTSATAREPSVRKFDLDSFPEEAINRLIKMQYRNNYDKLLRRNDRYNAVKDALNNASQHIKDEQAFYTNLQRLGESGRQQMNRTPYNLIFDI
jgi:hypothetical protein